MIIAGQQDENSQRSVSEDIWPENNEGNKIKLGSLGTRFFYLLYEFRDVNLPTARASSNT